MFDGGGKQSLQDKPFRIEDSSHGSSKIFLPRHRIIAAPFFDPSSPQPQHHFPPAQTNICPVLGTANKSWHRQPMSNSPRHPACMNNETCETRTHQLQAVQILALGHQSIHQAAPIKPKAHQAGHNKPGPRQRILSSSVTSANSIRVSNISSRARLMLRSALKRNASWGVDFGVLA